MTNVKQRNDLAKRIFLIRKLSNLCTYTYIQYYERETEILCQLLLLLQALATVSSVSVREAPWPSESMAGIASLLLEYHANPDAQDSEGNTSLQRAVSCCNDEVFTILLSNPV